MKRVAMLLAGAACVLATPALAQDDGPNLYGNVGYSYVDADEGLSALTGRLGVQFTPELGLEVEATKGIDKASSGGVDTTLQSDYAAYLVAGVPATSNVRVFGRIGKGKSSIKMKSSGVSTKDSFETWRYGVGLQVFIDETNTNGFRVDFTRTDDDDFEANMASVSYVRNF